MANLTQHTREVHKISDNKSNIINGIYMVARPPCSI